MSILALYRRLFPTPAFKKKSSVVGALCLAWWFAAFFTDLFQCHPFEAAFNAELLFTDRCINVQAYYWAISSLNLVLDVIMLYLPLQMVWRLKISKGQRLILSGIFTLGSV